MTNEKNFALEDPRIRTLAKEWTAEWVSTLAFQPTLANQQLPTFAIRLTQDTVGTALRVYRSELEQDFTKRLEWQKESYEKKISELQEKLKAKQGRPKK